MLPLSSLLKLLNSGWLYVAPVSTAAYYEFSLTRTLGHAYGKASISTISFSVRMVGSVEDLAQPVAYCNEFIDSLAYHDKLLVYGAPTDVLSKASGAVMGNGHIPSSVATVVMSAMFGNACPFIQMFGINEDKFAPPFSFSACNDIDDGLLIQ